MFICKLSICIFICINICQPYTAIFFKIGLSICTPVHHGLPIRNDQLWIILDDSKKSPLALCRKLRLFEFLTCLTFGDSRCFFFGDEDCECAIDPLHYSMGFQTGFFLFSDWKTVAQHSCCEPTNPPFLSLDVGTHTIAPACRASRLQGNCPKRLEGATGRPGESTTKTTIIVPK